MRPLLGSFAALLLLGLGARAEAEPDTALVRRLDAAAAGLVRREAVPGVAFGAILPGGATHVRGFGRVAEGGRVPDGDTVFEIASISKAFTGVLLADLVREGHVRLDQPVAELLPDTVRVPAKGDRAILLRDLATHASGLPRMPVNFRPGDWLNPYVDYTYENMYAFLDRHELRRAPGEAYEYSNLGMALLGHALARSREVDYPTLLARRITGPLEMTRTAVALTPAMKAALAQGHNAAGFAVPNWDLPTFAGAGGIRSTVHDMLRFLRAHVDAGSPLHAACREALRPHFRHDGTGVALGWHLHANGSRWHNGETGGYQTYAAVHPERKVAVVLLANGQADAVDVTGVRMLRLLLGAGDD